MSAQEVASSEAMPLEERLTALKRLSRRLALRNGIAMGVLWLITIVVAAIFIFVIIDLLVQSAPTLVKASFYGTSEVGIAPVLFNTFYIILSKFISTIIPSIIPIMNLRLANKIGQLKQFIINI